MLVNIVRYAKGWVEFKATGKFPERMLNITSRFGINLWDAHPCDGGLNASMSISDYRKIRPIARKAKVKTRITQKHGLPFFAEKYKTYHEDDKEVNSECKNLHINGPP